MALLRGFKNFESRQFRVLGLKGLVLSLLLHLLKYHMLYFVAQLLGYNAFFERFPQSPAK